MLIQTEKTILCPRCEKPISSHIDGKCRPLAGAAVAAKVASGIVPNFGSATGVKVVEYSIVASHKPVGVYRVWHSVEIQMEKVRPTLQEIFEGGDNIYTWKEE